MNLSDAPIDTKNSGMVEEFLAELCDEGIDFDKTFRGHCYGLGSKTASISTLIYGSASKDFTKCFWGISESMLIKVRQKAKEETGGKWGIVLLRGISNETWRKIVDDGFWITGENFAKLKDSLTLVKGEHYKLNYNHDIARHFPLWEKFSTVPTFLQLSGLAPH